MKLNSDFVATELYLTNNICDKLIKKVIN